MATTTGTLMVFNYNNVLRDICDSDKFKIHSKSSHEIKMLQRLCLDRDEKFESVMTDMVLAVCLLHNNLKVSCRIGKNNITTKCD